MLLYVLALILILASVNGYAGGYGETALLTFALAWICLGFATFSASLARHWVSRTCFAIGLVLLVIYFQEPLRRLFYVIFHLLEVLNPIPEE